MNNSTSSTNKHTIWKVQRRAAFRIAGSVWTFGAVLPFLKSMTLWNMGECLNLFVRNTPTMPHFGENDKRNLSSSNKQHFERNNFI